MPVPLERDSAPGSRRQGQLAAALTLRDGHLVEFDVVHHRPNLPALQHGVPGNLAEVHHAWGQRRHGLSESDQLPSPKSSGLEGVTGRHSNGENFWNHSYNSSHSWKPASVPGLLLGTLHMEMRLILMRQGLLFAFANGETEAQRRGLWKDPRPLAVSKTGLGSYPFTAISR